MEQTLERELEQLYTVKAAALLNDQGESTLRRLISTGQVRVVRVGVRGLRIPLSEVRRLRGETIE